MDSSVAKRSWETADSAQRGPGGPDGPGGPVAATETNAPPGVRLTGVGVSAGVATGPALRFKRQPLGAERAAERERGTGALDPAVERAQAREAVARASGELRALATQVAREVGVAEAGIFEAQALMLDDPTILERTDALIAQGLDAYAALAAAAEEQAGLLAGLPDATLQARAMDVRDAAHRALGLLAGRDGRDGRALTLAEQVARAGRPVIVLAEDLAPSDTALLRRETTLAIALAHGSATAHAAILARALGIPAVAGVGAALFEQARDGDMLIVDGGRGEVVARPTKEALEAAEAEVAQRREARGEATRRRAQWRLRPGRLRDGRAAQTLANIGSAADARMAVEMGAEGVGLLRTEFLFAGRATLPDEFEQAELYGEIFSVFGAAHGGVVTIRTLDVGADKPLPALDSYTRELPMEENPALGVRGIRLQLYRAELLATQFRGILRAVAATGARARVMLPMVATVEELRAGRELFRAAQRALAEAGVRLERTAPLGMMVETPAAVFSVEALLREAAFASIGTNDLTQYVMAADRLNPQLASLCQPTQPAVLRAIATITRAARRVGRQTGVCGEMAGEPRQALLLIGLGIDELSMTPQAIPAVKEALARWSAEELRAVADRALLATTQAEAEDLLQQALPL